MRTFGWRNFLCLAALLIVMVCFLIYRYSGSIERDETRAMLKPRSTSQKQELVQVLKKTAMSDRTIILTMVDKSVASRGSVLDVFLQSFKHGEGTQRLLNHLVIIAMDHQAYKYCSSLHPHCIRPSIFAHYFASKRQSITKPDHSLFSLRRNNVMLEMLHLGYNIIFSEADVLWLRSPLSHFNPIHELTISCNFSSHGQKGGYLQDGGILFLKANAVAFEFFKYWKLVSVLYPKSLAEGSLCATIKQNQDTIDSYGFRVKNVDTIYFGGFCQLNKDRLREAYTIHANCCEDLTSKVHDLRMVLDDWIRIRKNVSGENVMDQMPLARSRKCTGWKFIQNSI